MKSRSYFAFALIFISIYMVLIRYNSVDEISTIIATIGAIIGGVALFIQLKRDKDISEASFLMDYNHKFLESPELTKIQKILEDYSKGKIAETELRNYDRRSLINYLVYLEALAVLVNRGVIRLSIIDDLFSFNFFLAVNNPVLQELELVPDAEFYKGCYKLHKNWTRYKIKHHLPILLEETSLKNVENYRYYSNPNSNLKDDKLIKIHNLTSNSDIHDVSVLIYDTDEYIYPQWLNHNRKNIRFIDEIIRLGDNIFTRENILVAKLDNKIVGIVISLTKSDIWPSKEISKIAEKSTLLSNESWNKVNVEYFETLKEYNSLDTLYISNVSVNKDYQGKGFGRNLLYSVIQKHGYEQNLSLHVLKSNRKAINLYESFGFEVVSESKGFTLDNSDITDVYMMRKKGRR